MMSDSKYHKYNGNGMVRSEELESAEREANECVSSVIKKKSKLMDKFIKKSVLLCESPSSKSHKKLLKDAGYNVFVAKNVREFLNIMSKTKISNVVIDLNTPGIDIRQIDSANTHVIMSEDEKLAEMFGNKTIISSGEILELIKSSMP